MHGFGMVRKSWTLVPIAAVFNHMPRHRVFNKLGKCKLDMLFFQFYVSGSQ